MNEMKLWMMQNLGITEGELIGTAVIMGVCLLIWLITYMKRKSALLTGCLIRLGSGVGVIYLMNFVFAETGMNLSVGLGPLSLLTSAILGIPGVCMLYGILLI